MTDTQTPDHESDNKPEQKQPSDARIILGPLVKYAAIGLVLVAVIVTTAVTLDRQFNTIDEEVAALQAELAKAHDATETGGEKKNDQAPVAEKTETPVNAVAQSQPATEIQNAVEPQPVIDNAEPVEQPSQSEDTVAVATEGSKPDAAAVQAVAPVVEPAAVIEADVVESSTDEVEVETVRTVARDDFFDQSMDEIIAERNAYLKEMDRIYLEEYRASQQRQLQLMRDRLARQEQRIKEMEQRYQEIYDVRAANLREMQEWRDDILPDRI